LAYLGIDFGTDQVRVALAPASGRPAADEVIEVPAVFSFDEGRVTVGEIVLLTAGFMPDVVVHGAKRMLGRAPGDPMLERVAARHELSVRAHGRGDLWLGARGRPEEPGVSLERAIAALLEHAVEMATGERHGHDVVLAVPAWYGPEQRVALLGAAERAHLHVERFVLDTVAAAVFVDARCTAGVVDAGAGGVSAAVVRGGHRCATLLGAHGDTACGGEEIVEEVMAASGIKATGADRERLRRASADLVAELATASELSCEVPLSSGAARLGAARWELELLLGPLADRIAHACAEAARELPVERAYVFGGMMEHEVVREAVARRWGEVETLPAAAPVLGAALVAAIVGGRADRALDDGEAQRSRTLAPSSLPAGIGAPTSSRLSAPARPRPEVTRRRLSAGEIRAKRQSVGLTPAPTSVQPRSNRRSSSVQEAQEPPASAIQPQAPRGDAPTVPAPPDRESVHDVPFGRRAESGTVWPNEGTIAPPSRPEDVLTLPIARPMASDEVDPVALPVLLRRRLCLPGVCGVLRLEGPGLLLQLPIEERSALITKEEAALLRRACDAPRLRWRLDPFVHDGAPRQAEPLPRLALEGIRRMLRHLDADDFERAFGERLEQVPVLRTEASLVARHLSLEPRETRLLERHLDAITPLEALGRTSDLGAPATLRLMALLELYGAVAWQDVANLADMLADRADRWERAAPLEVLGLSADAAEPEIDSAYRRRWREYRAGGPLDQICPDSCAAIRHRLEEARAILTDGPGRRDTPPETARSSSPGRSSQP
jgi:hypothetical protein